MLFTVFFNITPNDTNSEKSLLQNDTEDDLTVTRLNKRSKNSGGNSIPIPIDLLIEIFSRFPANYKTKYIARCRCVSKLWASILYRSDYTDSLFSTKSSARPQLLFACQRKGELFFFSSPQPQDPNDNSSTVAASYPTKIPFNFSPERFSSINGFLCLRDKQILSGRQRTELSFIYNPSTGQRLPLPKMKTIGQKCYFGYDPIEKQYKVLSMTSSNRIYNGNWKEYQVLTLGTGKPSWRLMECCVPHFPLHNEICINGLLYYRANGDGFTKASMIVCFDFRSEKFRFMEVAESFSRAVDYKATLINYNGKLGSLRWEDPYSTRRFELWVLQDFEKHEWSNCIYVLPPLSEYLVGMTGLHFVGVIGTDEIVLLPDYPSKTFYVFYYNIKRNTIAKVEIQGMEALNGSRLQTLLNHVENVNLM